MKNYYVRATKNFKDTTENEQRIAGESEFYCTKERYEFLKSNKAVELIEVIEEKETKNDEIIEKTEKVDRKKKKKSSKKQV